MTKLRGATEKRKQSIYLQQELLEVLEAEAQRQDRSLSWLVQRCVRLGLPSVQALEPQGEAAE